MNKIISGVILVLGLAAVAVAAEPMDGKTCGQHMAEKAVLPAKMAEVMTSVADMMDAHAALMMQDKTKESKAEAAAFKKAAKQHRKLAAEFKKTEEMMAKMASLPGAPHDMAKMQSDPATQAAMAAMMASHKEMAAMLNAEVAQMEAMAGGGKPAMKQPVPGKK